MTQVDKSLMVHIQMEIKMNYTIQNNGGMSLGKKIVQTTEMPLEKNELFRLDGDQRGLVIKVAEGRVWLTKNGQMKDILLEKGQTFRVNRHDVVLLEGIPSARVSFSA
jgi:hypothetical protein